MDLNAFWIGFSCPDGEIVFPSQDHRAKEKATYLKLSYEIGKKLEDGDYFSGIVVLKQRDLETQFKTETPEYKIYKRMFNQWPSLKAIRFSNSVDQYVAYSREEFLSLHKENKIETET